MAENIGDVENAEIIFNAIMAFKDEVKAKLNDSAQSFQTQHDFLHTIKQYLYYTNTQLDALLENIKESQNYTNTQLDTITRTFISGMGAIANNLKVLQNIKELQNYTNTQLNAINRTFISGMGAIGNNLKVLQDISNKLTKNDVSEIRTDIRFQGIRDDIREIKLENTFQSKQLMELVKIFKKSPFEDQDEDKDPPGSEDKPKPKPKPKNIKNERLGITKLALAVVAADNIIKKIGDLLLLPSRIGVALKGVSYMLPKFISNAFKSVTNKLNNVFENINNMLKKPPKFISDIFKIFKFISDRFLPDTRKFIGKFIGSLSRFISSKPFLAITEGFDALKVAYQIFTTGESKRLERHRKELEGYDNVLLKEMHRFNHMFLSSMLMREDIANQTLKTIYNLRANNDRMNTTRSRGYSERNEVIGHSGLGLRNNENSNGRGVTAIPLQPITTTTKDNDLVNTVTEDLLNETRESNKAFLELNDTFKEFIKLIFTQNAAPIIINNTSNTNVENGGFENF